jgi:uncharacterized protein (TIGR04255 family)
VERRVYANDPIQEALCEFRFRDPKEGWSLLPGRLYDPLKAFYPREPSPMGTTITPPFPGAPSFLIGPGAGQVRLQSEDGRRALLVGQQVMSIHVTKPYPQWESFSRDIERVLRAFAALEDNFDLERIGMRYINRVEVPHQNSEISRYFQVSPLQFPTLDLRLQSFLARTEQRFPESENRVLVATFASVIAQEDQSAFVLDLDVVEKDLEGINTVDLALDLVRVLRKTERTVFESAIKEDAREAFGGYSVVEDA